MIEMLLKLCTLSKCAKGKGDGRNLGRKTFANYLQQCSSQFEWNIVEKQSETPDTHYFNYQDPLSLYKFLFLY